MSYADMVAPVRRAAVVVHGGRRDPEAGRRGRHGLRARAAVASLRSAPTSGSPPTTRSSGQPEILLGIIPGAGGTQRLARLVGPAKAKDIIFTGRFVGAEEALQIGLVDQVVPAAEVYDAAVAWAARFSKGPAFALRAAKRAIDRGLETDLATGLEIERQQFAALFATEDQEAGMTSFVENGPGKATFTGR